MKITLEFNDEELQRADQSFHGPEYAAAAEDFRNALRNIIKHEDLEKKDVAAIQALRQALAQDQTKGEEMKITLEFNDEELQRADQAFHGPEYAAAAEDFRNSLRNIIKHEEYSEETGKFLTIVQQEFFNCFEGLLND